MNAYLGKDSWKGKIRKASVVRVFTKTQRQLDYLKNTLLKSVIDEIS